MTSNMSYMNQDGVLVNVYTRHDICYEFTEETNNINLIKFQLLLTTFLYCGACTLFSVMSAILNARREDSK